MQIVGPGSDRSESAMARLWTSIAGQALLEGITGLSLLWMCRGVAEALLPGLLATLTPLRKLAVSVCGCDAGTPGRVSG